MRPFITLGMATFLMLLALAVTSTTAVHQAARPPLDAAAPADLCRRDYGADPFLAGARKTVVPQFEVLAVVAAVLLLGFRAWWALRTRTHAAVRQPRITGRQDRYFNISTRLTHELAICLGRRAVEPNYISRQRVTGCETESTGNAHA